MGKKKKTGNVICDGTINTGTIYNTHRIIKSIVDDYTAVNDEVYQITKTVKENWVGKGRNEFESQYNILIKKIDDFGDTLYEIYDALVDAEAQYEEQDDSLRQSFTMAMQE